MAELRGGQLWVQEDFPCHRCFVVYLGGDSWCRIPPPLDGRGCIAYADDTGKVVLSKKEMLARFAEYKYTLKGQYYDVCMNTGNWPCIREFIMPMEPRPFITLKAES